MKKRIHKLDELTANKIAAGEVVDKPASVVKELVENSIDAEAKNIVIEIKDGGKTYIRVSDDGSGIFEKDVEIAFERHATSKIRSVDDLSSTLSLGFRGEALASIASVSQVEMITRHESSTVGIQVRVFGGKIVEKREVGCPIGTTMIIQNLFYNTPARFEFMKSNSAEAAAITDIISKLALSHSNISFQFINNGTIVFTTSGSKNTLNNIINIYGKDLAQNIKYIKESNNFFSLEGYISNPSYTRGNRQLQIFFVNGRYVKSKVINQSIDEAYKMLVLTNRYPICFIYLNILPSYLDVNIHPTKTEIRIKDEEKFRAIITKTIKDHLLQKNSIPNFFNEDHGRKKYFSKSIMEPTVIHKEERPVSNYNEQIVLEDNLTYFTNNNNDTGKKSSTFPNKESVTQIDTPDTAHNISSTISNMNILGQVFRTYIIGQDHDQLYLIDQHAAHEKILFEELLCSYKNNSVVSQRLIAPIIIELFYSEFESLKNNMNMFKRLGFEIEEFGTNSFLLRSVPMVFGQPEAKKLFMHIVDNLPKESEDNYDILIEKIILQACKSAIKANDRLSDIEMKELIKRLSRLDNPYTCPHGRPIIITLTKNEIEKRFKRT